MKKVLVVTASYNSGEFIEECALSVSQSITTNQFSIEHVIVDDASTDNSRLIIEKIALPTVKKIFLPHNVGAGAARNYAVRNTDADYVFIIDADDVLLQNSLRYLFEYAESHKVEWVYGDFLRCNKQLSYLVGKDYYGWTYNNIPALIESMYTGKHFFQQNSFFSRNLFLNVGGFDETMRVSEDFDLCTRMLLKGYIPYYIKSTLYFHRFHDHNISIPFQNDPLLHKKEIAKLYQKYMPDFKKILTAEQFAAITAYFAENG